ncbi:MAG TPA: hypothetical protein VJL59_20785 [Anaerolineales bacterium]|nr:hypothetical protein [Anaerolineales bacterium]
MSPHARPPTLTLIGALLFVALLGSGGIYAMTLVGRSTPPPPAVVILAAPGQTIITDTPPPTSQSSFVRLTLEWTVEPLATPTATHGQTDVSAPTAPPTAAYAQTDVSAPTAQLTAPYGQTDVSAPTSTSTPAPTDLPRPFGLPKTYLPTVSARAREIYQYGLTLGNNPRAFTRLGDCHSAYPGFLGAFDSPTNYRLGDYGYLQDVINYYSGSFSHDSQSANSGFHMGSYFSPLWADPTYCNSSENPMECEYRIFKPGIIFINVGTLNEASPDEQYESFVRPIIEWWIAHGVVPILNTKADNIEGGWRFNAAVRRLAAEYDVPLWDFWIVSQSLPNQGLESDMVHLYPGEPFFDDPNQMLSGWALRNLTGLQALDVVWRSLQQP